MLLSHIAIVEITDCGERGMNPVTMTIVDPQKEYLPSLGSNQCPPILKSGTLPTELGCSAKKRIKALKMLVWHLSREPMKEKSSLKKINNQ